VQTSPFSKTPRFWGEMRRDDFRSDYWLAKIHAYEGALEEAVKPCDEALDRCRARRVYLGETRHFRELEIHLLELSAELADHRRLAPFRSLATLHTRSRPAWRMVPPTSSPYDVRCAKLRAGHRGRRGMGLPSFPCYDHRTAPPAASAQCHLLYS
jgi:hypothetical protein